MTVKPEGVDPDRSRPPVAYSPPGLDSVPGEVGCPASPAESEPMAGLTPEALHVGRAEPAEPTSSAILAPFPLNSEASPVSPVVELALESIFDSPADPESGDDEIRLRFDDVVLQPAQIPDLSELPTAATENSEPRVSLQLDAPIDFAAEPVVFTPRPIEATPPPPASVDAPPSPAPVADLPDPPQPFDPERAGWSPQLFWRPGEGLVGFADRHREPMRVPMESLDTLLSEIGEISVYRSRLEACNTRLRNQLAEMLRAQALARARVRLMNVEIGERRPAAGGSSADGSEPDPLRDLSRMLVESVDELAALQATMEQAVGDADALLLQQSRVDTRIQQDLMSTLKVPFSRVLMVEVDEETYAVPLSSVDGIARIARAEVRDCLRDDGPLYACRDRDYRVRHLADYLGLPHRMGDSTSRSVSAILVSLGEASGSYDRDVALVVDRLLGHREVVPKASGRQIASVAGIAGATLLADGRMALVLDLPALLNASPRSVH